MRRLHWEDFTALAPQMSGDQRRAVSIAGRRACAARRLHRSHLHHAAAVAGGVRPDLRGARRAARACSSAPWRACKFPPVCCPNGSAPPQCWRSAPRSPVSVIASPAPSTGFVMLLGALLDRRPRLQHAASDRLGAGRPRLCRAAFAQGARHLQFHRRSRQDDFAGDAVADAAWRWRGVRRSPFWAASVSPWRR